jgi:NAD(P)-dependent dehydrogenase (short-subunit alcohol dehydrogenase family)
MTEFRIEDIGPQKGRIAIVTGANTGLGYATAKALAGTGMKVIMACRNREKAIAAKNMILKAHPGSDPEILVVDLLRLSSVREFAAGYLSRFNRLDLLINNAGIMIPPYMKTEDGFESQMAVNYFAHFLLTGLLFDTISKTPGSRIISLSSLAHKRARINFDDLNWEKRYSPLKAYGQSKVACLLFAFELNRRIQKAGLGTIAVAAHPGISLTELMRHIPAVLMTIARPLGNLFAQSPEKGALPTLYAALAPDVKGGDYIGPQGFGEWTGQPGKARYSDLSRDEKLAGKLWEVSEKLTGVSFP